MSAKPKVSAVKRIVTNSPKNQFKDIEEAISKVIEKGGKTTLESREELSDNGFRLTLSIPRTMVKKIDELRKTRAGKVSRTQWIIEAIHARIEM